LLIFLALIFYIASYTMTFALTFEFDEGGEGMSIPGATENVPPVADAGTYGTMDAGDTITLDASGSTDNAEIVYYIWNFRDSERDIELYGETAQYTFMAAGTYNINLVVVDSSWNMDEDETIITVMSTGIDTEMPTSSPSFISDINAGSIVSFDGSGSFDDVGVINYTWTFYDYRDVALYGVSPEYRFQNAGSYWVSLTVRDASGNIGQNGFNVNVMQNGDDYSQPEARISTDELVSQGDTVTLDATESWDDRGIVAYTWYVKQNATIMVYTGETAIFTADHWGPYDVTLVVRDDAGNAMGTDTMIIALPLGIDVDAIPWTATPFGQDVSFNLLTFAYGAALLASVIYTGGLFAKGFAHEIQKGTLKILFFGPISVTTMIFSKILYPIVVGPIFIFPLALISLSPFDQSANDILMITLVSYILAVLTMVSAAYGSCLIYFGAKRMVLKPTVVSRMFMYLSLIGTMTVFEWLSFLFDQWFKTSYWGDLYLSHGPTIAIFSPFHQGGVLLSNMMTGSEKVPDWGMFIIPVLLIVLGVLASRKLYPDLFTRE
ncbi:MAG: PKD domain-containing protein, partial [Thermoplasmata archaeon]|nr:PKD domain-containing protein [Thermoplasmata archaeon]